MSAVLLKLKQASAVLGVAPKDLQNLVQFGVLRPRKSADVFWFDANLLLQAKLAFFLKASFCPSTEYLAQFMSIVGRVNLVTYDGDTLLLACAPEKGKSAVELKIPLRDLKNEIDERLPLAKVAKDLPRGRKRRGWKSKLISTLQQAGRDIGEVSEDDVLRAVRSYRTGRKKHPEITLVTKSAQERLRDSLIPA